MLRSTAIKKEALYSLLRTFDSIKRKLKQLDGPKNELLTRITEKIQRLRNLHDQFKELEQEVTDEFMAVVRNANEILNEIKSEKFSAPNAMFCTVDEHLSKICDKMLASISELPATNSGTSSPLNLSSTVAHPSIGVPESPHLSLLRQTIGSLDDQLKHCLFCLSIFPERQKIKKKLLIHWWIGEGIVKTASDGNICFDKLVDMDLIIPIHRERCQEVHSCKQHPWLRKLFVSIAQHNGFLLVDSEGNPSEEHSRTHRAFLRKGGSLTGSNQEVLTLYNVDEQYLEIEKSWFFKESQITLIQLGRWQVSGSHHIEVSDSNLVNSLGKCKKLKYLSLRGISRIENLPSSIQKLKALVVLDLRACHNLEKLPGEIKSLKNLVYLDVSECYLLEEMPKGLEHLSELEVLKGFVIASSRSKNPGRLSDLTKLTKLQKLSITIGQESAPSANEFKKIIEIEELVSLTITWGLLIPIEQNVQSRVSEMNLTFPPKLQKLDLRCFPAISLPDSISPTYLTSLKKLYLSGGMLQTISEKEGWQVEVLCVNFLKELNCEWEEVERCFQAVKLVKRHECPHLNDWPCDIYGIWKKPDTSEVNNGAAVSTHCITGPANGNRSVEHHVCIRADSTMGGHVMDGMEGTQCANLLTAAT